MPGSTIKRVLATKNAANAWTSAQTWGDWNSTTGNGLYSSGSYNVQVWHSWTIGSTTADIIRADAWYEWNTNVWVTDNAGQGNTNTNTNTNYNLQTVWHSWAGTPRQGIIGAPAVHIPRVQETEESRRLRLEREAAAKLLREEQERLRKAAEDRAERLLLSVLSEEQKRDWAASGHFFLHVGDRKYRIGRTRHGGLSLVDGNNQEIENLCVQVRDDVPAADNALAQLFLLKHDEEHIVRTANVSRLRPGHASLKTLLNEGRLRKAA